MKFTELNVRLDIAFEFQALGTLFEIFESTAAQ
jgi:hypothetical protein